jgi:glycerol transport system ATP-binding protein
VYDNLAFPLRNRGVKDAEIRSRVQEVSEMLELNSVLRRRAQGLTADEKQKISLGRGLVRSDVTAVLFDEPLTVIDPHLKWQLRLKLKEIHERFNLTMVYVTHDQIEALTFADWVVVMLEGQVVQLGSPQDLFESPQHTFVGYFIGSPGMNILPCTVDGYDAVLNGHRIALAEGVAERARTVGGELKLGIRPVFLQLSSRPAAGGVPVRITDIEDLGTYRIVTVSLGEHRLRVHLSEDQELGGETASLTFPPEWTKLYADDVLVK